MSSSLRVTHSLGWYFGLLFFSFYLFSSELGMENVLRKCGSISWSGLCFYFQQTTIWILLIYASVVQQYQFIGHQGLCLNCCVMSDMVFNADGMI